LLNAGKVVTTDIVDDVAYVHLANKRDSAPGRLRERIANSTLPKCGLRARLAGTFILM
jgi:hypothetical protein